MEQEIYSADVKAKARESISGKLGIVILAGLIFLLLTQSTSYIDSALEINYIIRNQGITGLLSVTGSSYNKEASVYVNDNTVGFNVISNKSGYKTPLWLSVLTLVVTIITIPLSIGYVLFYLKVVRNEELELSMLFSRYNDAKRLILLYLYKNILIFLQTLLLIIPGIIAAFSYAMTDYIVAEDENISITDAVKISKEMMRGHKMEYFWLTLSFIGWFILCGLTGGILYIAYVGPYYNATMAAYYDRLKEIYNENNNYQHDMFAN